MSKSWECLVQRFWPLGDLWRSPSINVKRHAKTEGLLNCRGQHEVCVKWQDRQSSLGTLQPRDLLCMMTDVGFVTCRCYSMDSEVQGRIVPCCSHPVLKVNPSKQSTLPTSKWQNNRWFHSHKNGLIECFIQVKATAKLPLSTCDTILPLKTLS